MCTLCPNPPVAAAAAARLAAGSPRPAEPAPRGGSRTGRSAAWRLLGCWAPAVVVTLSTAAAALPPVADAAAEAAPPVARTVDAADTAFGLTLPDPYRWMEGENNAEFGAWLQAQGRFARGRLDALPRLAFWRETLGAAGRAGTVNRLQTPSAGKVFFLRLAQGKEGVLMLRERDGRERLLLDPATLAGAGGTASITGFSPSPDGRRVAVNIGRGGGEITRIEILEVDSGRMRAGDAIDDVWGELQADWLPDGSGFGYLQLRPAAERNAADPLLDQRFRLHRLGRPPEQDPVLVTRGENPSVALNASEFPFIAASADSPYALLLIGGARAQTQVCVAPRAAALRPQARWRCLVGYEDNVQQVALRGRHLYLVSMRDAPNGRLLEIDLARRDASLQMARVALPEEKTATLTGLAAARDALYVRRMAGGPDTIVRLGYGAAKPTPVALPFVGAAYRFAADARADGLVFTLQSWTRPRVAYRYAAGRLQDLQLGASAPRDYAADLVAEEVQARSADGTAVPLTIVHRRDAKADGRAIAILDGYGGYGISQQPAFDPMALEWAAAGHVFAVAHVRGGGELGDAWRIGGNGPSKERGVEDFIACAEALERLGWAAKGRVAATGASMGGVLIGGAITRDPARFGAAIIQAGMLNPSRIAASKNGENQFAELGDPRTAAGLRALAAMDPTQRIQAGTAYPAVLLVVGLNDNRVPPWNSGKFGARLAAASASGKPVWFRADDDMGHFNTTLGAQALESADQYAFIEAQIP